ncbi:rpc40 [Nucleospora cyclopteri]
MYYKILTQMNDSLISYKTDRIIKNTIKSDEKKTLRKFLDDLKIKFIKREKNLLEFDLLNAHPSLANALRRILISEVETYAFHDISIFENKSVFPDEYIAHRLGLIPVVVHDDSVKDYVYELNEVNDTNENITIYSDNIVGNTDVLSIEEGVIICKLAPGNKINLKLEVSRGNGEIHSKWSPVSLCTYRLMPRITLQREFCGEEARELQKCFPEGVISIIDGKAVVDCPRKDKVSREAVRIFGEDAVELGRESNWFCFTIETLNEDPVSILRKGILKLREKSQELKEEANVIKSNLLNNQN